MDNGMPLTLTSMPATAKTKRRREKLGMYRSAISLMGLMFCHYRPSYKWAGLLGWAGWISQPKLITKSKTGREARWRSWRKLLKVDAQPAESNRGCGCAVSEIVITGARVRVVSAADKLKMLRNITESPLPSKVNRVLLCGGMMGSGESVIARGWYNNCRSWKNGLWAAVRHSLLFQAENEKKEAWWSLTLLTRPMKLSRNEKKKKVNV